MIYTIASEQWLKDRQVREEVEPTGYSLVIFLQRVFRAC